MTTTPRTGMTVIELLVTIAIIGLICVFAATAVHAARSKQRDATRLASVRMLQSALEDHFNEVNAYPEGEQLPLGDVSQSICLGTDGFAADCSTASAVFLRVIPATYENGLDGLVTCGDPARRAFCYSHLNDGESYAIEFELENGLSQVGLQKGVNCASPNGMVAGACAP